MISTGVFLCSSLLRIKLISSRPLMSGSETSSTKHAGPGVWGSARNSIAHPKVSARQPAERISSSSDSRTNTSSSTTRTSGVASDLAWEPESWRGLVVVEVPASGRGKASTLALPFVSEGPWWDGDINAELFEAVLGYSRAQGSARLLIAAMAALADEHRVVAGLTTEQLCAAAGVSDRTYRRVREPLLASGELVVRSSAGGRGNTNRWEIPHPRSHTTAAARGPRRRLAPPGGARPLLASVTPPVDEQMSLGVPERAEGELSDQVLGAVKGGQDRTVSPENRPALSGVSGVKGCQDRTVSSQTPAKTPAKPRRPTRPREGNPRTPEHTPPTPRGGERR